MKVHCKAVFRDFSEDSLSSLKTKVEKFTPYRYIGCVSFLGNYVLDNNPDDPKTEWEFFYEVPIDEKVSERDLCHTYVANSIREINLVLENVRDYLLINNKIRKSATISVSLLSKEIFPKKFALRCLTLLTGFYIGNIANRCDFLPTTYIIAPQKNMPLMQNFMTYSKNERDIEATMAAIFEHDRKAVNVMFPDEYSQTTQKESKFFQRIVELQANYSAVRRVIFHFNEEKDSHRFFADVILQLSAPVEVYIYKVNEENKHDPGKFRAFGLRFLTWNKKANYEESIAHASCIKLKCIFESGRDFLDLVDRLQKTVGQIVEFRKINSLPLVSIVKYSKRNLMEFDWLKNERYFPLAYAIEALVSRGGPVYDHFFHPLLSENGTCFEKFVRRVTETYNHDEQEVAKNHAGCSRTVAVLEEMLNQMDRQIDLSSPLKMFDVLYTDTTLKFSSILTDLNKEGYMRVRKIVITPTRKLYVSPELIMGNRSLRTLKPENMLRIVFRDDNNRTLSPLPEAIINDTVAAALSRVLVVGCQEFSYLGSSNSQMRDHGCYFIRGRASDAMNFRKSCGKFSAESIPKLMSRIGQVFTQSQQLGVVLHYSQYSDSFDYTGGCDGNGKPYTFSDGVGRISGEYCRKIVQELQLGECRPSCYQIRFRGYKGVLCLDTELDRVRRWMEKRELLKVYPKNLMKKLPWYQQSIIFRASQKKFTAPIESKMEIVKVSTPINVNLNKPLINILDQVSEMQSPQCHERITRRIRELLEQHIKRNISSLTDEHLAKSTLNSYTKILHYHRLHVFHVTEEPFFRLMLRATAAVSLQKLVAKMQIRIPRSLGRMMFGVIDETGLLQYGQVFFQYTIDCDVKYPTTDTPKCIHKGPVMITKNPSVVAGDVRMFEAVDLPALHDLVDVIIFPQSGPRPHPDEMAGSDLDGDEYSIFWDPLLFLERNEPAFDFTAASSKPDEKLQVMEEDQTGQMIDFFIKYISQDSIGHIANAHLANSDLYGLNNNVCHRIARKHTQAVDFPKTGQIPEQLTKKWSYDSLEPPEAVERFPNFMAKNDSASYVSRRLLGELHTRVTELCEMIGFESLISENERIKVDRTLEVPGYRSFFRAAETEYNEYRSMIENLCESYGIRDEGELFSENYSALKKQISARDDDDMSLYNTSHMISEQLRAIVTKFRDRFFREFGGTPRCTVVDSHLQSYGFNEPLRRVCDNPTVEMCQKAYAYYYIAYSSRKCLSFGWIVSEIMVRIRMNYLMQLPNMSCDPLSDKITERIRSVCNNEEYKDLFNKVVEVFETCKSTKEVSYRIAQTCSLSIGFLELIYFIRKWAAIHSVNIPGKHLDYLVYIFGSGELHITIGGLSQCGEENMVDLNSQIGGLGRWFLEFLQFLMSYKFGHQNGFSLMPFSTGKLTASQCFDLNAAANQTYYPIALNRRFDVLPGNTGDVKQVEKCIEGDFIVIEIPKRTNYDYMTMIKDVALRCGCKYIVRQKKPEKFHSNVHIVVCKPVGTFRAIQTFRRILSVEPSLDMSNLKARAVDIAEQVLQKLHFYSSEGITIDVPFERFKIY
ncbi:hypothetical protein FO519_001157 [Halicephalobus sp. NKZ332]|nr:hypothetical protein FO519_001157 [Halicephalobus sp. NKZ332]